MNQPAHRRRVGSATAALLAAVALFFPAAPPAIDAGVRAQTTPEQVEDPRRVLIDTIDGMLEGLERRIVEIEAQITAKPEDDALRRMQGSYREEAEKLRSMRKQLQTLEE